MFLTHFKMNAHPFHENPPVQWILQDQRIAQGLARLQYFAEHGSIALLIGHTGVGKSSLLRLFIKNLPTNRFCPLYVHLTHINSNALLRMIVTHMGEAPRRGKDRLFLQIIERANNTELSTVLIIDEAHLIDPDALTDLRLLVSSAIGTEMPLKIILSGQDPLAQLLKRASYLDLVHRISVRFHLKALNKDQSAAYIDSRLRCCGASDKLFQTQAKAIIHDYANGIPRQINNIATACLINAAAQNLHIIDESLVNQTISEFHLP